MNIEAMAADKEYRDVRVAKVKGKPGAWDLTWDDGWSFSTAWTGKPTVGMSARLYGRGTMVRGLVLGDTVVYYRTPAEDEQHRLDSIYPKTAREALAWWDAGRSVFTIEMGGLGPGYEQCIAVGVIETLRVILDRGDEARFTFGPDGNAADGSWEAMDAVLRDVNRAHDLGLSGAQAGAIKSLAFRYLAKGWQATLLEVKAHDASRLIQVSNHWPGRRTA